LKEIKLSSRDSFYSLLTGIRIHKRLRALW